MIGLSSRIVKHLSARRELGRMLRSPHSGTRAIAAAIIAMTNHRFSADEWAWVKRVAVLERDLASRTDEMITFTDFGTGDRTLGLTAEQMAQGREVTRSVAAIYRKATLGYMWRILLFRLIRSFKPRSCIELGTSLGVSASVQAAALELNRFGMLATLEGGEELATVAQEHFGKLGLSRVRVFVGRFQDTLTTVLRDRAPVDYVFVDGHHDEQATLQYFQEVLPYLSDGAVLIFDDIRQHEGMERAWNRLTDRRNVSLAADLGRMGICTVSAAAHEGERFTLRAMDWTVGGRLRRKAAGWWRQPSLCS